MNEGWDRGGATQARSKAGRALASGFAMGLLDPLAPMRGLAPSIRERWFQRQERSAFQTARVVYVFVAVAHLLHLLIADPHLALTPPEQWLWQRSAIISLCLVGFFCSFVPALHRLDVLRLSVALTGFLVLHVHALSSVWIHQLPQIADIWRVGIPYIYAAIMAVVFALALQATPLVSAAYVCVCLAVVWPSFSEAHFPGGRVLSVWVAATALTIILRSRLSIEVAAFIATVKEHAAETQLLSARAEVERQARFVALGRLIQGMSHEVGNPLNFADGGAAELGRQVEELRRVAVEPSLPREKLNRVIEQLAAPLELVTLGTRRIKALLEALRQYSPPGEQDMAEAELGAVLRDALANQGERARASAVSVTVGTLERVLVACRSNELGLAFENIITNACEAMPTGGTLTVRERLSGTNVEVAFSDTGPGVPEALRNSVFDPFFTTKEKAIGLGLSVAQEIVRRHGGEITLAASHADTPGATIRVTLPRLVETRTRPLATIPA